MRRCANAVPTLCLRRAYAAHSLRPLSKKDPWAASLLEVPRPISSSMISERDEHSEVITCDWAQIISCDGAHVIACDWAQAIGCDGVCERSPMAAEACPHEPLASLSVEGSANALGMDGTRDC